MSSARVNIQTASELQKINFDPKRLLTPALFCCWMLCYVTFSPPDDWRVSRFGVVPVLPPKILAVMKLLGRGGALGILSFSLLSVWRHQKRHHVLVVMSPLLILGAYGIISTSWSALKSVSLQHSLTFCMLLMLATYIGTVWRTDRDTERIVKHLSLMIFTLSLVLIALRFGMPRSGALTKDSTMVLHSTNACAAGGLGILLTLSARLLWCSPWSCWWFPIVGIELGMMLLAGNRLSIIVTSLSVFLLFVFALHRGLAALLVLVGAVAFCGYFVCDPSLSVVEVAGRKVGAFARQDQSTSELGSLSGRAEMWGKMWKSYEKSPVLGHGCFVTTAKGRIYVWHEWGNWTAHNAALQILVTLGAIGLGLLLLGFASLTVGVVSGSRVLSDVGSTATLLLLCSVWFLCWGILNESFAGPLLPEVVVFTALLGVAAGVGGSARFATVQRPPLGVGRPRKQKFPIEGE